MNEHTRIENLKILFLIFWIATYGGFELGFLDFWDDFILWRKLCLFLGWLISTIVSWLMPQRTLKQKGYVNLLWLGLPVPTMSGIVLFVETPLSRPFLITVVLLVGLSILWFAFQKLKTRVKAEAISNLTFKQA